MKYRPARLAPLLLVLLVMITVIGHHLLVPAYGERLGPRSLQLSSNEVSATSLYTLSFELSSSGPVGSIRIQFCSNDPLPGTPCTIPTGFTDSTATLTAQSGATGFVLSPASTSNDLILGRSPVFTPATAVNYQFNGITNPSVQGSYYVRMQTYATPDATGPASDYGGVAFMITNSFAVSATVPPYLIFCTGVTIANHNCATAQGDYIDLGELASNRTSSGTSQFLIASNAANGYDVSIHGTTLTSGNTIITPLATQDVSRPGRAQFGLNTRANATPALGNDVTGPGISSANSNYNQPNFYRFVSGDSLVSYPQPDDIREYTTTYITNVPATQAAGVYVSTLTYICLANF